MMNTNKNIVLFDDTCYCIEINGTEYKFKYYDPFFDSVKCLLSEKQLYNYVGNVYRNFKISDKKINNFIKQYINE